MLDGLEIAEEGDNDSVYLAQWFSSNEEESDEGEW
jgi:hypothetical protein